MILHDRTKYTPYGEEWIDKFQDENYVDMPYKFTGKERDEAWTITSVLSMDLYYYGARYLDPQTSVWLSTDPALGEYIPQAGKDNSQLPGMGGIFNLTNANLYHYAGNNPVRYVDPDGNNTEKAVEVLKRSSSLQNNTKEELSSKMISNLYSAENKRMSFLEKLGIDGSTIGRGQVSEAAYTDVKNKLRLEFSEYLEHMGLSSTDNFKTDMKNEDIEDFIVAGYLSICIDARQQEGRSKKDATKFGIAFYHGARKTIVEAQNKANDKKSFSEIEKILKSGNKEQKDILKYIKEVMNEN